MKAEEVANVLNRPSRIRISRFYRKDMRFFVREAPLIQSVELQGQNPWPACRVFETRDPRNSDEYNQRIWYIQNHLRCQTCKGDITPLGIPSANLIPYVFCAHCNAHYPLCYGPQMAGITELQMEDGPPGK